MMMIVTMVRMAGGGDEGVEGHDGGNDSVGEAGNADDLLILMITRANDRTKGGQFSSVCVCVCVCV